MAREDVIEFRRRENFSLYVAMAVISVLKLSQYSDWGTDWMTGVRFPAEAMKGFFSVRHRVRTGSGAHPASYPMGTGGSSTVCKAVGT
jgi:hypothetical protein